MPVPKFDLEKPRYDQSTYFGRVARFFNVNDPRMVFVTKNQLDRATSLLDQYRAGTLPKTVSDSQLWQARKIRDGVIHPDTGEVIPVPFRMSFFVFANVPICVGMLLTAPTVGNQLFWQWANQSYNAAFNFGNRNATLETNVKSLLASYLTATSVACGVAYGLGVVVKRASGLKPAARLFIQRTVPFTAVASAGACNALAMRYREAFEGIDIRDSPNGEVVGKSVTAGRWALAQVAASRIALPLPILMLPPYIIPALLRIPFIAARPKLKIPVELAVITVMIMGALPCAIALFPQLASIPATSVEAEFQNLKDRNGNAITTFYYNKGL